MTEQFEDQGGFATSDPSPLMRWLTSRVMTRLFKPERIEKRRVAAERQRRKDCLLYTSPSPRDVEESRMPSSA